MDAAGSADVPLGVGGGCQCLCAVGLGVLTFVASGAVEGSLRVLERLPSRYSPRPLQ